MIHMSTQKYGIVKQGLVRDPEAKHVRRMRQAVWLFLFLIVSVNRQTGRRLISPVVVAQEMGLPEATVRSWLGHLRKAGYLSTQRQGRLVRVKIVRWPRIAVADAVTGDSGPAAGHAAEAHRLAEALGGNPDDPMWADVLRDHAPDEIERARKRALAVPAQEVRKSRVALFRYFLHAHS